MHSIDVTFYFNKRRLDALKEELKAREGCTIEDKVEEMLHELYKKYVPEIRREKIEALIESKQLEAQVRAEASRRFSVIHIKENGRDDYFTNDYFQSALSVANRYRLYSRNELSSKANDFREAFPKRVSIYPTEFLAYTQRMYSDARIQSIWELDLDKGIARVCDNTSHTWKKYNLKDISVAVGRAMRPILRADISRQEQFLLRLAGKELEWDGLECVEETALKGGYQKVTRTDFEIALERHALWFGDQAQGEPAIFSKCVFEKINLSKHLLLNTVFENCEFIGVDFSESDISFSVMNNCHFIGCDFTSVIAEDVEFKQTVFEESVFNNGAFTSSNFKGAMFQNCEMYGGSLENCCMEDVTSIDFIQSQVNKEGISYDEAEWCSDKTEGVDAGIQM